MKVCDICEKGDVQASFWFLSHNIEMDLCSEHALDVKTFVQSLASKVKEDEM